MKLEPTVRRSSILSAAVVNASRLGYLNITGSTVAEEAGVSRGLVTHYFFSMRELRRAVMAEAVRLRLLPLVREGIAARDPIAMRAPEDIRREALR